MSEFYCPYWNCPLSEVTDLQQDQCFVMGKSCINCMADAEEDDYVE